MVPTARLFKPSKGSTPIATRASQTASRGEAHGASSAGPIPWASEGGGSAPTPGCLRAENPNKRTPSSSAPCSGPGGASRLTSWVYRHLFPLFAQSPLSRCRPRVGNV